MCQHGGWQGFNMLAAYSGVSEKPPHTASLPPSLSLFLSVCASLCGYANGSNGNRRFYALYACHKGKQWTQGWHRRAEAKTAAGRTLPLALLSSVGELLIAGVGELGVVVWLVNFSNAYAEENAVKKLLAGSTIKCRAKEKKAKQKCSLGMRRTHWTRSNYATKKANKEVGSDRDKES